MTFAAGQTFRLLRWDRSVSRLLRGASGDFNPIHIDPEVGAMTGLGGVILHGLCTMAWATDAFARFLGDPGLVTRVKVRFRRPVRLEDTLTFEGTVTEVTERLVRARLLARNQRGEDVLRDGSWRAAPGDDRCLTRAWSDAAGPIPPRWGWRAAGVRLGHLQRSPPMGHRLLEDLAPVLHDEELRQAQPPRLGDRLSTFAVVFAVVPAREARCSIQRWGGRVPGASREQEFEF
jgi:acyl dehydratase